MWSNIDRVRKLKAKAVFSAILNGKEPIDDVVWLVSCLELFVVQLPYRWDVNEPCSCFRLATTSYGSLSVAEWSLSKQGIDTLVWKFRFFIVFENIEGALFLVLRFLMSCVIIVMMIRTLLGLEHPFDDFWKVRWLLEGFFSVLKACLLRYSFRIFSTRLSWIKAILSRSIPRSSS